MRSPVVPRALGALLAVGFAIAAPARVGAEDRISFRGNYYREASTRVIQPMLEATADLPKGYDIGGHFAVDAISSASVAAGTAVDSIFHETRYEGGLVGGKTIGDAHVGAFVRYSHEPDYLSYSGGVTASREVWGRTGTVGASLAFSHDYVKPIGMRAEKDLKVGYLGLSYAQILSPTTLVQGGYELFYVDGFYCNPYIAHANLGREVCPEVRIRHALSVKLAQYFPAIGMGVQLHYRFYFDQGAFTAIDPWGMTAHTIEPRIYKSIGADLEVRFSYRYHWQGDARWWCNSRPDSGGDIGCYGLSPIYHSVDPKFGHLTTHLPELKLAWDMRGLADVPALAWLSRGTLDVSYGYYFESAYYGQTFNEKTLPPVIGWTFTRNHGGAHLMQTGYSLPF